MTEFNLETFGGFLEPSLTWNENPVTGNIFSIRKSTYCIKNQVKNRFIIYVLLFLDICYCCCYYYGTKQLLLRLLESDSKPEMIFKSQTA